MRVKLTATILALLVIPSSAADGKLNGDQITSVLTDTTVYEYRNDTRPWRQYFGANGATPYYGSDGPASHGRWQVRGDQYCSLWPPSNAWSCYDVTSRTEDGKTIITWIPPSGGSSIGVVYPGNRLDQIRPPQ